MKWTSFWVPIAIVYPLLLFKIIGDHSFLATTPPFVPIMDRHSANLFPMGCPVAGF
jgi:hypothetical protein